MSGNINIDKFSIDLPKGAMCEYLVYRGVSMAPVDVTYAHNEEEAIDKVYQDYSDDRDEFWAERKTVSSAVKTEEGRFFIEAATFCNEETKELGIQILYPDGVLHTISCRAPKDGVMTC